MCKDMEKNKVEKEVRNAGGGKRGVICKCVKKGLIEGCYLSRLKGGERASDVLWRKSSTKNNNMCKGPEVEDRASEGWSNKI